MSFIVNLYGYAMHDTCRQVMSDTTALRSYNTFFRISEAKIIDVVVLGDPGSGKRAGSDIGFKGSEDVFNFVQGIGCP